MRAAVIADAEALAVIRAAAFAPAEAWTPGAIAAQLDLPGGFGVIDPGRGMILARVAADEAELLTLAVTPASRRRGIGATLLRAALCEAHRRGARVMFLEVSETNAAARSLYGAAGFHQVGRRRHYYADRFDALVLRLALSPCAAAAC